MHACSGGAASTHDVRGDGQMRLTLEMQEELLQQARLHRLICCEKIPEAGQMFPLAL